MRTKIGSSMCLLPSPSPPAPLPSPPPSCLYSGSCLESSCFDCEKSGEAFSKGELQLLEEPRDSRGHGEKLRLGNMWCGQNPRRNTLLPLMLDYDVKVGVK